jgi:hypothetical protein
MEDAVDVLTLKDNSTTLEDFATALHLLARVQVRYGFDDGIYFSDMPLERS